MPARIETRTANNHSRSQSPQPQTTATMTAAVSSVTVIKSTTRRHPAIAGRNTRTSDHDHETGRKHFRIDHSCEVLMLIIAAWPITR
jgi:hypothetical protein